MISRAKKYVAVLLAFVCVCMIFSPQTAYASEDSSQHETVKAGCAGESDKNNFRICSLNYINEGIRGRDHNG